MWKMIAVWVIGFVLFGCGPTNPVPAQRRAVAATSGEGNHGVFKRDVEAYLEARSYGPVNIDWSSFDFAADLSVSAFDDAVISADKEIRDKQTKLRHSIKSTFLFLDVLPRVLAAARLIDFSIRIPHLCPTDKQRLLAQASQVLSADEPTYSAQRTLLNMCRSQLHDEETCYMRSLELLQGRLIALAALPTPVLQLDFTTFGNALNSASNPNAVEKYWSVLDLYLQMPGESLDQRDQLAVRMFREAEALHYRHTARGTSAILDHTA